MDKMILGAYTFEWNPTKCTIPKKTKSFSIIKTYSSAVHFSWGTFLAGQKVLLEWDFMGEAQWNSLQALVEADTQVQWTTGKEGELLYNVEVDLLDGRLFETALQDIAYMERVRLLLIIMGSVV